MSRPTSPRIWRLKDIRYRLLGTECQDCRRRYIGVRPVCPSCGSIKVKSVELSRTGRVITYTLIASPPKDRDDKAPYVMAIIELDDGAKLTAELVDYDEEELRPGLEVEMAFRRLGEESEEGLIYYGYKFRPLR